MKRILTFAFVSVAAFLQAQTIPIETAADRKPKTVTNGNCLIRGAMVVTITKGTLKTADVLVRNGKIAAVGTNLVAPAGVTVIDGRGKVLMPGIVDTHSHRGVEGVNESTEAITAETRIVDSIGSEGKPFWQALASGHTTALFLHGSANPIGGESMVGKYKYKRPTREILVQGAPRQIKFALGENVTQKSSTTSTRFPKTRMGVEAFYRRTFTAAKEYRQRRNRDEKVPYDVRLETVADILDRKVWVQCHSYRADEMLMMVRLSQEFGFKLGTLQHALEAYKIAPEMAAAGVGAGMFVDNWAFKMEAWDAIPFNAAICQNAGVSVSINTDGLSGTSALNLDAARAMRYGGTTPDQALAMLTINPARQIGVANRVGSIEVGKDADLALWDGHPLSVTSKPVMTMIEGDVYFERRDAFGVDKLQKAKLALDPVSYGAPLSISEGAKAYAISGARIEPVSGPAIAKGNVIVRNGKIAALGQVPIPADAVRIPGGGLTVMPGFTDCANTIGLSELSGVGVMTDTNELGDVQPDLDASRALFVENVYMGTALWNGVTHSFTRPIQGLVSGRGAIIQHFGYTTEQMAVLPRVALNINFPSGFNPRTPDLDNFCCGSNDWASLGFPWLDGRVDPPYLHKHDEEENLGGAPAAVAAAQGSANALQKLFDDVKAYADSPRFPRNLRFEAMMPYAQGKSLVVLRVRNAASIRAAVEFAKKNGLKVALEGADEAYRETALLKKENIPVIINPAGRSTLGANSPVNDYDPYDTPYVTPHLLAKAGVRFAFSSGGNSEAMSLPLRVGTHLAYGLTYEQAQRALCLEPARIFGFASGSLEAGKAANFIVVAGNPFEPTGNVRAAFLQGRPVPLVSKHTQLRDKYWSR